MRALARLSLAASLLWPAGPAAGIDLFGLGQEEGAATWSERDARPTEKDFESLRIHGTVVEHLNGRTGATPEFLQGPGGREAEPVGLTWRVGAAEGARVVSEERERLAKSGYAIFLAERNFGIESDRIGLLPATDPLEPVRVLKTAGPAVGVSNAEILAKLEAWRTQTGLELLGVGTDWIEVEIPRLPGDLDAFVTELRELAPDSVGRTPELLERLREELERTHRAYLWWD